MKKINDKGTDASGKRSRRKKDVKLAQLVRFQV